jgi:ribulose-phosphate 3-epimerase
MEYMRSISPSLLAADYGHLADAALQAEAGGAGSLHLDYMDGHYVPNLSFGIDLIPALKKRVKIPLMAHLMISNTEDRIGDFIRVQPDYIVIQEDAVRDIGALLDTIEDNGIKTGIATSPSRSLSNIEEYLPRIDHLLILGVNPGFGGQRFMTETLDKMKEAHAFRTRNKSVFDIAVDGGVNFETAGSILKTGVNILVAGTAIFGQDDIKAAIHKLSSL